MRAVSNLVLAFLLLGALLWGNCLSCPQLLLSLASHSHSHGCCKPSGKQPATSRNDCQSFALKHFVRADPAPKAQLQAAANAHFVTVDSIPPTPATPMASVLVLPYSPPDLEVLNSSIRI